MQSLILFFSSPSLSLAWIFYNKRERERMYAGGMTITSSSQRREIVYTHRLKRKNSDVTLSTVEHATTTTTKLFSIASRWFSLTCPNLDGEISVFSRSLLKIVLITFLLREISSSNERSSEHSNATFTLLETCYIIDCICMDISRVCTKWFWRERDKRGLSVN